MVKFFVVCMLVLIVGSLGSALYFLMQDRGKSDRTVRALTIRVGLSIALFLFLVIGHRLGWNPSNS